MQPEPFEIRVEPGVIDDLYRRIDATIWPQTLPDAGWDYGTDVDALRQLVEHWRQDYDWREHETYLNGFANFTVALDGMDVHYIHERSQTGSCRLPLVLTHGWPSTVYELCRVIEPLTRAGFDVVVPSLPGYGWSSPPEVRGFGVDRVADLWAQLMDALGYEHFGAHGGDWGAAVTTSLGARYPDRLTGIHVNMLAPPIDPSTLDARQREWWDGVLRYRDREWGYVHLQRTKPQTASFGLTDSPVGLAAWILEKWWRWSDIADESGRRDLSRRYTPAELLTTITIYWVTRSIGPSMRMYYETFAEANRIPSPGRIEVPLGVAAFKEMNRPPRELAEPHYRIARWTHIDDGGHFPGLENPELLAHEISEFFGSLSG